MMTVYRLGVARQAVIGRTSNFRKKPWTSAKQSAFIPVLVSQVPS